MSATKRERTPASAFTGANALYVAGLHAAWARDPDSVDPSFAELFALMDEERQSVLSGADSAPWGRLAEDEPDDRPPPTRPAESDAEPDVAALGWARDSVQAIQMIRAYRVRGHLESRLDPLGLRAPPRHADLDPASYGFNGDSGTRPIYLGDIATALLPGQDTATLDELLDRLRAVYCGPIGAEYMHIQDPTRRHWLQRRLEGDGWRHTFSPDQKRKLLHHLTEAEGFEAFCHKRFVGTKRFGLEGGEVTICALHAIIDQAAEHDVRSVSLGMPHRGRLNTMANVVRKPFAAIFAEFAGASFKPDDVQGSGDVKYHLGTSAVLDIAGRPVEVTLLPNPSHLEAVDPVVVGRVRAIQDRDGCTRPEGRTQHLALLVHGDAAFAGQGIVYETMAMSQLIGYRTGGTVHVVINNQIGFTTVSAHGYSGLYCTDTAKAVQAPILHVNGDEPEAVAYCARLATDYRQAFGADIVLDIVCYRRHGHNEADEPSFTQPSMYKAIAARPTVRHLYLTRLIREGVLTETDARTDWDAFARHLGDEFEAAQSYRPDRRDWQDHPQDPTRLIEDTSRGEPATGLPLGTLRRIGTAMTATPPDVHLHAKILRQLAAKARMFAEGEDAPGLDWATAEALAFGGLVLEGHRVRLSGEDCQRGTFSQRHAVLIDQVSQDEYVPINTLVSDDPATPKLEIYNSLLSEFGVLGFEYGYSLGDPDALVLWEAQFGDFANGAQVIIDQFVASGETKWLRMSGLVMLLPHGYEGQGPEHSSARLERYLQLCAENNLRVCYPTTPANYFHVLRRQMARDCRKPLILMTPKSLLRHKLCVSPLADCAEDTTFRPVITDDRVTQGARRVVLCSGKVYYDLLAERDAREITDVALVRVEQLYPFPGHALAPIFSSHPDADIIWCQEEPENMGAWSFVDRRIERALAEVGHACARPRYAGRAPAASPATGLATIHAEQQAALVDEALTG
ncbi:2-oxoglutarate dehydrogenase E1 component [Tanticharoenia sakaeratensis]|uniref:2-oxoglutarate dehydrogenase E1 component n=1 Tax=Tanticharoenia sakaeratensis NBRC 103193 TaxID=1231623 RepID=A0A0D6MNY4_9PROT|nr:2-oxoglutarate dehydrogenase E1 component [Tanticharoenia sakaeratensis]GAN54998.1 2-oxoglutarate dehydrogenase, E1 subunit [Tanticharoenia sakaeratensis NBRC 103193]GBQ20422.1 2-oxoglutarate dehydrogenase E1 [Tanticharoenia sakaeratensis NBRC 103193]